MDFCWSLLVTAMFLSSVRSDRNFGLILDPPLPTTLHKFEYVIVIKCARACAPSPLQVMPADLDPLLKQIKACLDDKMVTPISKNTKRRGRGAC